MQIQRPPLCVRNEEKIGAYTATEIVGRFLIDEPLGLRERLGMTVWGISRHSNYDAMEIIY